MKNNKWQYVTNRQGGYFWFLDNSDYHLMMYQTNKGTRCDIIQTNGYWTVKTKLTIPYAKRLVKKLNKKGV